MENFKNFYSTKKGIMESVSEFEDLYEDAKEEYEKFFKKKLAEMGAESPADLSEEDKKEFFSWIKDNWDSKNGKPKK